MPFPVHWRLRIEGEFLQSGTNTVLEQWSNTINFDQEGPDVDVDAWLLTHAVPAAETLYMQSYISQSVIVTALKFNEIGGDGRYTDPSVTHEITDAEFTPIRGTSTTYVEPQRALAVSWTTGARRGPAHRGRIYLPGLVGTVSASLSLDGGLVSTIASNAATFLATLSTDPTFVPAVVSKIGTGSLRPITGVEVGNRVDTIRRRRNHLQEAYSVAG